MDTLFPRGGISFIPDETMPLMYDRPASDHTKLISEDASVLSSHYKLVYKQWKIDRNDELLLSGYFRQCNVESSHLPKEVRAIATSYYLKQYTELELLEIMQSKQIDIANRKRLRRVDRKERWSKLRSKCEVIGIFVCFGCSFVMLIAFIVGVDVAGLSIINTNDCDLSMDAQSKYVNLGIKQFLFYGCVIHLVTMTILWSSCVLTISLTKPESFWVHLRHITTFIGVVLCIVLLSIFSWSIVGILLYSEMKTDTISNKQCADIVISWAILKIMECLGMPFMSLIWLFFVETQKPSDRNFWDDTCFRG